MGQRRDFAIFLSTILFGAVVAPGDTVKPFVSLGKLRRGSHSHYCMATVVKRDEPATHTGARRLFAITTELCNRVLEDNPSRHAQFELGPAEVLGWKKGDLKEWDIDGRLLDSQGLWSRVGVVMLQAEGFDEAVALADWKSGAMAELIRRKSVLAVESEALQNVPMFVADWNDATGLLTRTATIVPIEKCFPGLRNPLQPEADLKRKQDFICVQTRENIKFSYGAPLYKVTGQDYNLLGTLIASQYIKMNQHLFLNVHSYIDTVEDLIVQLQSSRLYSLSTVPPDQRHS